VRRDYLIIGACQGIAAVATIAALRWLATYVDPETFGRFTLFQSVVSAGTLFFISWPNAALLRFGREEWTRDRRIGATLAARVALFAGCAALAITFAWLADPWLRTLLRTTRSPFPWIAAGLIAMPAAELAIYVNQATGRSDVYGYSPAVTRIGFFAGVMAIPFLGRGVEWTYLAACLVAATATAAGVSVALLPRTAWSGFALSSSTVATLLRYSWSLPLAAFSTYVVNWVDSWVIRNVRGLSEVGVYNWAYQTTTIASLAFAPLAVILTPRMIDARLKNDALRIARYADSILPAALALACVVGLGSILVFPVLRIVASPAYLAAYPVILVLAAALPFQLIAYLVTPVANAHERLLPRFVFVSAGIAVLNAAGDILLVPLMGMLGAAIATTTAFLCGALMLVAVVRREGIGFAPLWQYALPAAIVGPGAAVLHLAGPFTGAISVCGATIIVVVTMILARRPWLPRTAFENLGSIGSSLTLSEPGQRLP
jgi:O-antigen/teichoic acid export membrane protein